MKTTWLVPVVEVFLLPAESLALVPPGCKVEIGQLHAGDRVVEIRQSGVAIDIVVERAERYPLEVSIEFR